MNFLAAVNNGEGEQLICQILLFATIIALLFGLAQVLGVLDRVNTFGGRFGGLLVFVVLLIAYVLFC